MCTGLCIKNQIYLGTWVKFIRSLNFFITKPISWYAESEDNVINQKAFFYTVEVIYFIIVVIECIIVRRSEERRVGKE